MDPDSEAPFFVICDGDLRDGRAPAVSLSDGAIARGNGLFETIAVYAGRPFLLDEHLERLRIGAARLGLEVPSTEAIEGSVSRLLEASELAGVPRARLRLTLTEGPPHEPGSRWFVEATPAPAHAATATAVTLPFARNEQGALSGLKTINYGENVIAMRRAREAGADEGLFGNTAGNLCEGTWSNVFVFAGGGWITPPLDSGCLPGVTRALVLELAANSSTPIREAHLPLAEMERVEAAFLTSSLREIQPLTAIDGRPLASASHGEIAEWSRLYRERVHHSGPSLPT